MASVRGKSGSSNGGGNQPPNKRSKTETDKSSKPESDQDSLHSNQPGSVSSMTRVQPETVKCPVCQEYPRLEVYQCDEGHIVCNQCIVKITRCPFCRALYPPKKIRNRVAEAVLDEMKFNCSFRNSGCLETNIPRNKRTAHEIQCDHNPSKPGFKFCGTFDFTRACKFRIDPNSIIQDPEHSKDVIEHWTGHTSNLRYYKVEVKQEMIFRFRLATYLGPAFQPVRLLEVYDGTTLKTIGYYVLILRFSISGPKNLSWAVVGLNSAPGDLNGGEEGDRHSDRITVKLSIKAKTYVNKVAKDGAGCVPNQSWTIKSMYLDEWKVFMYNPIKFRPPFSFSIPVSFLEEYYEQQDGMCEMSVSFGPFG